MNYKIQNSFKRIVALVPVESGMAGGEMKRLAWMRQAASSTVQGRV
jgi:hypothetical protein